MSILDIILIILIGTTCIYGITKGFIRDIFSLIAIIVGVVAALIGYPWAAGYLSGIIPAGPLAGIVGFTLILLSVSIAVSVLGVVISKAISGADLSVYDRIAGACFGLIEGIVAASLIVVITSVLIPSAVTSSRIAPPLLRGVNTVITILPPDTQKQINESKKALEKMRNEAAVPPEEAKEQ
jgi:membrane protein required for colicin V production